MGADFRRLEVRKVAILDISSVLKVSSLPFILSVHYTLPLYFRVATLVPSVLKPPVRALTYCSTRKGKRKTVKSVVHRFLRLHSGLWLRRKVSLCCVSLTMTCSRLTARSSV